MSRELIAEQVELSSDIVDTDNTFDIFFDNDTSLIHAFENDVDIPREFVFKLKEEQDKIASEHRMEILEYCLSKVNPQDEVSLADIFIHGKYVERVL